MTEELTAEELAGQLYRAKQLVNEYRDEVVSLQAELTEAREHGEWAWGLAQAMVPPEALEAAETEAVKLRIDLTEERRVAAIHQIATDNHIDALQAEVAALRRAINAAQAYTEGEGCDADTSRPSPYTPLSGGNRND